MKDEEYDSLLSSLKENLTETNLNNDTSYIISTFKKLLKTSKEDFPSLILEAYYQKEDKEYYFLEFTIYLASSSYDEANDSNFYSRNISIIFKFDNIKEGKVGLLKEASYNLVDKKQEEDEVKDLEEYLNDFISKNHEKYQIQIL